MATVGLQSHIWNNNLKSIVLLGVYPFIIMAVVWAVALVLNPADAAYSGDAINHNNMAFANNFIAEYWPIIITAVGIWFAVAFFFHTAMIRGLSHSHPVSRQEEPELYNLLENLAISQGMKTPRLEIIETHARNAFASGIDEKSYTVTVTRGLLQSLSRDEVEAVLAHELTHIINRDVRLLIVTIVFTSMLGFAAQMMWSNMRYALWVPRQRRDGQGGQGALMALLVVSAILWVGYFATLFTRFALTRRREYMADAGAVQMTRNPEAMMRALMRIAGMERIPKMPEDVNMMCVENSKPFMGLFATHPPIEKRIQVLSETTRTDVPSLPARSRPEREEVMIPPANSRDNWVTRQRFASRRNPWG